MDIVEKIESLSKGDVLTERFRSGKDPADIDDEALKDDAMENIANGSYSIDAGRSLRREYSRKCWPMFEMYGRLKLVHMGYPAVTEEHVDACWNAISIVERQIKGAFIEAEFNETLNTVIRTLRNISRNPDDDRNKNRAEFAGKKIRQLTMLLAGDKEIGLSLRQDPDGISAFPKVVIGDTDAELSDREKEAIQEGIGKSFSNSIYRLLRRNFRADGWAFFAMYGRLRIWEDGLKSVRRKDVDEFFNSVRYLRRKLDDGILSADLKKNTVELRRLFRKILKEPTGGRRRKLARQMGGRLLELIERIASSKDVYFRKKPLKGKYWFKLNKARPAFERLQQLEEEDPEHYALKKKQKEIFQKLKSEQEKRIIDMGLKPEERYIMGKPVMVGIDPASEGDDTETEEIVFDDDGQHMPMRQYIDKREQYFKALNKMSNTRIFPDSVREMSTYTDEEVREAMENGKVEYKAITDDKGKSNALTRIMPVVEINGEKVIAGNMIDDGDGGEQFMPTRFSGVVMDDLVNVFGRMVEGVAYNYDPDTGVVRPMETKGGEDGIMTTANREPYITVADDGSLLLNVTKGSGPGSQSGREGEMNKGYTVQRNEMKDLDKSPWVQHVKRDWASSTSLYKVDPEGFLEVREILQNFVMSKEAVEQIDERLKAAKVRQDALTKERLRQYSPALLGGFKDELEVRDGDGRKQKARFQLNSAQLEALAYLDSNGDKGICALETGVGKTVTAMGYIQNLKKKGVMSEGDKVLYVAPTKLVNNLENQAKKFVKDYDSWIDGVDSMSSYKFLSESKKDDDFMGNYVAIIFDEATETIAGGLGGGKSKTSEAAQRHHPRKVLLTASPMNKSPVELYTLDAIVNNVDIKNDSDERKKMFSFLSAYCERMGGRYVSISKDPTKAKALKQWIKGTMYFADKEAVEGYDLPGLSRNTKKVSMEGKVARKHRARINKMYSYLGKYKDELDEIEEAEGPFTDRYNREIPREEWVAERKVKAAEKIRSKGKGSLEDIFAELEMLSLLPGRYYKIAAAARSAKVKWINAYRYIRDRTNGSSPEKAAEDSKISLEKGLAIEKSFGDLEYDTSEDANPKAHSAARDIREGISANNRYVIFTDSPQMAASTTQVLAEQVGGNHVVAYSDRWELWVDGQMAKKFTKRAYPEAKGEAAPKPVPDDVEYDADEWIDYLIDHWVNPAISDIHSVILTKSYSHGINLQQFNKVMHLDRDDWNAETMKQRAARVWRQGQQAPVEETNVDMVYPEDEKQNELDVSLDDAMAEVQKYDEQLFNDLIKDASKGDVDMEEGIGDIERKKSSFYALDDRLMQMELSPYISKVAELSNDNNNIELEGAA